MSSVHARRLAKGKTMKNRIKSGGGDGMMMAGGTAR
jgi:hypothetical protein